MNYRRAMAASALVLALPLAACSADGANDGSGGSGDGDATLSVMASFYPLQFLAERVGGDLVDVTSLAPAGTEPHDLELSPAQVAALGRADLLVYLSDFQPSVDTAVQEVAPNAVDVHEVVHLTADEHADEDEHADGETESASTDEHDHSGEDPHFWLDPTRMADAADAVADALAEADPAHAEEFRANADALRTDLEALDERFRTGLAQCSGHVIVTSHEAYGYLADRYGLEQVGISGLDPEAEPSPARLREIQQVVRDEGVTTIFTESLVNPKVADVLASDLGITTAVLDPVETLTKDSAGEDYLAVMTANLEALRTALDCA